MAIAQQTVLFHRPFKRIGKLLLGCLQRVEGHLQVGQAGVGGSMVAKGEAADLSCLSGIFGETFRNGIDLSTDIIREPGFPERHDRSTELLRMLADIGLDRSADRSVALACLVQCPQHIGPDGLVHHVRLHLMMDGPSQYAAFLQVGGHPQHAPQAGADDR